MSSRMSRGTFIYVVMLAVFGAGMWAILSFGSLLLRAPEDLSGEWQLYAPGAAGPDDPPVKLMHVEQSGRFFKIALDEDVLDMKLIEEEIRTRRYIRVALVLSGPTARLTFEGIHNTNAFRVRASGAITGEWLARRTVRPYGEPAFVPRLPPATAPALAPARAPAPAPATAPATAPADATAIPATSHARLF